MKTEIINLTRKPITIVNDKMEITIQPYGVVAKIRTRRKVVPSTICELIPVSENLDTQIWNVPRPQKNTVYLVTEKVGKALHGRPDVFYGVQLKMKGYRKEDGTTSTTCKAGTYSIFKSCE